MPLDGGNNLKNFAPVAPLKEARKTSLRPEDNPSSICALFREIAQEIEMRDEEVFRSRIETGKIIGNLIQGKLLMKRDPQGQGYTFLKPNAAARNSAGRDRTNYPLFPQNSVTLQSKWLKSRIECAARLFGDGYRAEIQTHTVNLIAKSYFRDIFTSERELRENLQAQMYGTYLWRFFYDSSLHRMTHLAPIVQKQSKVLIEGYAACKSCGHEGVPKDFNRKGAIYPQCPECDGYKLTDLLDPVVEDESVIVDVEEIHQGDIGGELLNFEACRYDASVLPQHSSYFRYLQHVPLRIVRGIFGEEIVEAGGDNDFGLEVLAQLAGKGSAVESVGGGDYAAINSHKATLAEYFLKPEWYAGRKLEKSERTFGGTIPAGVDLAEVFPDGVMLTGFNEMRLLTGIYAEQPNVVGGVYFIQPNSGIGKGVDDAVEVQEDLNELSSMAMAGLKRYGASGVFYDKSTLTPRDVANLFKPNKAVPVDLAKNPKINNISQAVGQIQSNPVNQALPAYVVQLSNLMNMAFLTGDFTQGMTQDVDINTFGGQQLAHAKAEEQKGAILTMKAHTRERAAEIIIELFRRHIKFPRFYTPSGADRHSRTKGKWISGEALPESIKFDAVPGSESANNTFEKRMAAQEMIEKAGGLAVLSQMQASDPKLTGWYASQFGTELPGSDEQELRLVCLSRLDDIKELSAYIPDPAQILEQIGRPLFVREDAHLLKAEFLQTVLDDDETSEWSPVVRVAAQALIERHYELEAEAQFRNETVKQAVGMKLQMQQAQMQQKMMQPQIDAQTAAAQEQQNTQLLTEGANRVIDEEQKEAEFERKSELMNKQHANAREIEAMRLRNK